MSSSGPPGETDWNPPTSGNTVHWNGRHVVKAFGLRRDAYHRERASRQFLSKASGLPVHAPAWCTADGRMGLDFVPGPLGSEAMEGSSAALLLFSMGEFLARLHSVDPAGLRLPGTGSVIVHGDFAPYNVVCSSDASHLRAVLDWEVAELGDPVVDLAWCEHQVKARWPRQGWAVSRLFDGYGKTPPAHEREAALEARIEALRTTQGASTPVDPKGGFTRWSSDETGETASFLAALSRVMASPAGWARESEVWLAHQEGDPWVVYLSAEAASLAGEAFGEIPHASRVPAEAVPPSARLVLDGMSPTAHGVESLMQLMTSR